MAGDRLAYFLDSAAECLLLASTATDPIVRDQMLERAEELLRLAEKHERGAASNDQPTAQQQHRGQPKESEES
jgi:hypothetical protein